MRKNQYVVRNERGWGVRGEGNKRTTVSTDTQYHAIDIATQIAKHQKSELRIQGRDGKFRDGNSYGKDPYPPKG